jgi:hypothetical protein
LCDNEASPGKRLQNFDQVILRNQGFCSNGLGGPWDFDILGKGDDGAQGVLGSLGKHDLFIIGYPDVDINN